MYGKYLARQLPFYLIMGILCSILLGINVTVMKYNRSLGTIIEKSGILNARKMQMKKDTDEVALRGKEIRGMRPEGFWDTSGDEFILKAVDDIRARMKEDILTVATINREPSEFALDIGLSFNFDTYYQVLRRLYDLDQMTFPFFRFTSFSFQKDQPERALCRIQGNIVMPVPGGGE